MQFFPKLILTARIPIFYGSTGNCNALQSISGLRTLWPISITGQKGGRRWFPTIAWERVPGKRMVIYTRETDEVVEKLDEPWKENGPMSESNGLNLSDSFENYLSARELIQMFVRIVAKGGNLNLMVNFDGAGKVPEIHQPQASIRE